MNAKSHEALKAIRFAGELLPDWAQLLDLAAGLCPVSDDSRLWFSRFTLCSGVDDSRTILGHCSTLRAAIQEHRTHLLTELKWHREDTKPAQILGAWTYSLDTMILEAQDRKTCPWIIEGSDDIIADADGGDITLRRV